MILVVLGLYKKLYAIISVKKCRKLQFISEVARFWMHLLNKMICVGNQVLE
jgi:hypothetical protein